MTKYYCLYIDGKRVYYTPDQQDFKRYIRDHKHRMPVGGVRATQEEESEIDWLRLGEDDQQ